VLVCVKSADTEQAGRSLAGHLRPETSVLSLQNGVDNAPRLRAVTGHAVIPVVVYVGSEMAGPGHVRHHGGGDLAIGPNPKLLARIKAVMRRRAPQLADDVVEIAGLRIDPAAHQVTAGEKPIDLWTTELRLLHFFMTHPGRVFSRARLLDEVWGEHVFVEERTVDVHIRRLRQALAPTGHDRLIETVRGTGYRFRRNPA